LSIRLRYGVSALRFLFVDQLISNLHTGIILEISSLSSKLGKIRYLEDFRPDFQITFVIITFLMWEKPKFSLKLEHFEILRILVAIL
jgi:hypothetical protein